MENLPHKNNACSGRFNDWLEVYLTSDCNGSCSWCVDRHGWHPQGSVGWKDLADVAISTGKPNVILLGGEPTLRADLRLLICRITKADRNVWMTTNGSRLYPVWTQTNLFALTGINVSIHHYEMKINDAITGIVLDIKSLRESVQWMVKRSISVRLNCNCIASAIDSRVQIYEYIRFAKHIGATSVRFAELKHDDDLFVDLAAILDHNYGLNDDPFKHGCCKDATIDGMPVNFRQMCGLQTSKRPRPENPVFTTSKRVLYHDGRLYNGWQTRKENAMSDDTLKTLLQKVAEGTVSAEDAAAEIEKVRPQKSEPTNDVTSFCQY